MDCPFCSKPLSGCGDPEGAQRCGACGALYLDRECAGRLFGGALGQGAWGGEDVWCPAGCGALLRGKVCGITALRCARCGAVVLRKEAALEAAEGTRAASGTLGAVLYALSLPERVGRTVVGSAAGAVKELAEALVPGPMKQSRLYGLVVGKSLRFLIEEVGGVAGAYKESASAVPEAYLLRKAVGNAVEVASLAALQVSPAFVLAVLSDVAFGMRSYLKELARELKELGVLKEERQVESVDDLLSSLEGSSAVLADSFDTPPLSVAELRRAVRTLKRALRKPRVRASLDRALLESLWKEMRQVASHEKRSLLSISSAVAMKVAGSTGSVALGAYGSARAAYRLLDGVLFQWWRDGLAAIRRDGWWTTVRENYAPYAEALRLTFDPKRPSFLERVFAPGGFAARLLRALRSFFFRKRLSVSASARKEQVKR